MLTNFDFLLHVNFLALSIIYLILQYSQFLTWNNPYPHTVFPLPLALQRNNTLVDIRLAFAGPFVFRSRTLENAIIGHRLPLTKKDIDEIQLMVESEFQKAATDQMISDVVRQQFLNLTRYSFEQLT